MALSTRFSFLLQSTRPHTRSTVRRISIRAKCFRFIVGGAAKNRFPRRRLHNFRTTFEQLSNWPLPSTYRLNYSLDSPGSIQRIFNMIPYWRIIGKDFRQLKSTAFEIVCHKPKISRTFHFVDDRKSERFEDEWRMRVACCLAFEIYLSPESLLYHEVTIK